MPWLTGTAFLHSIMLQEKRGMLKVWNASLILATGTLCVLGTFLVRSGILDSIHAFGASTLGVPFTVLIASMIIGSVVLVVSRRDALRSDHRLDSLLSREAVFLGNNLVLVAMCFVIFWGTFFPLIAEALTGDKKAVGPPWFDRYTVPLALMLVLLSGVGPLIAWRRATAANARRSFLLPTLAAVVTAIACFAAGLDHVTSVIMFALGAFVAGTVAQELWRGTAARRTMSGEPVPVALVSLVRRNRRRYGGYLVHLGMAVLFMGVAASSAFENARDVRLSPGESTKVGDVTVTYVKPVGDIETSGGRLEKINLGAVVEARKDGKLVSTLQPERGFYPSTGMTDLGPVGRYFEGEATSEIGLDAGTWSDVWTAVQPDVQALQPAIEKSDALVTRAADELSPQAQGILLAQALRTLVDDYVKDPPPATFRLITSPLVAWIWIGSLIVFGGGLVALWPAPDAARKRANARAAARVAQDLGRA
jgi:cytochrome c-type biogenesis protein CcmF